METTNENTDPLIGKLEQYANTSVELMKLKTIDKISIISSAIIMNLIVALIFIFLTLFVSLIAAFYIGNIFENIFYGFLIVSIFYFFLGIIFILFRKPVKRRFRNLIIKEFNPKLK